MISNRQSSIEWLDWLLFGVVIAVAAFLRLYQLADLPVGLPSDVAVNGNDAWRLLNRGGHTIFLSGNGGRESLFIYMQAVSIAMFGTTAFAVRLPGVLIDIATVGLMFWFARWLYLDQPNPWPRLASVWTGLAMAGSYWLLTISRLGFRAVLVPFVAVLVFWTFLHAWRTGSARGFVWSGLALGLTGYTYSASRILPLVLIVVLILLLIRNYAIVRARLFGLGLMFVTAAIVYLPMGLLTLTQPAQILNRTSSVAIWAFTDSTSDIINVILENIWLTARFFCCQGNAELLLFGLPGRPGFDIALGGLMIVGIGVSLIEVIRRNTLGSMQRLDPLPQPPSLPGRGESFPPHERGRAREGVEIRSVEFTSLRTTLLLTWFFIAWLPTLLAIEAPHPLRLIAAAPAAMLLVLHGMVFIAQRWRWLIGPLTLWLVIAMGLTFRDYFLRWPIQSGMADLFNQARFAVAQDIDIRTAQGEVVYVPQAQYAHPALRYFLLDAHPPRPIAEMVEVIQPKSFVSADDNEYKPGAYVRVMAEETQILPPLISTDVSDLSSPEFAGVDHTLEMTIGPAKLVGATYAPIIESGGILPVTLFWQAKQSIDQDFQVLVHLVDDSGNGWSIDETDRRSPYPTTFWQPQIDLIPDYHHLRVSDQIPVGRYRLAIALLDPVSGMRLPIMAKQSESPDTVFLGSLKTSPPNVSVAALTPQNRLDIDFEAGISLIGYTVKTNRILSGQPLSIDLIWEAKQDIEKDYTVFVHLRDASGAWVAGHDGMPMNSQFPTSIWSVGERVPDHHKIVTSLVEAGEYHLAIGLYDAASGQRLLVQGGELANELLLDMVVQVIDE